MNANKPPALIDSHCHLDLPAFDQDRSQVIDRARECGVTAMVVPAVSAGRWQQLADLASGTPDVYPAYGLHPMFMNEHDANDIDKLQEFIGQHDAVAIGECGLDFHQGRDDSTAQTLLLEAQLRIAREVDLPVILHARKALHEVSQCLRKIGGLRGVVHSFSGSPEQAKLLWGLGFHLGIGGVVTYPRAKRLRRIVADMPIEWLLLETDSPDQPLSGYQGQRNEPARLPEVLACIAELRQESPDSVARATTANTRTLFKLAQNS